MLPGKCPFCNPVADDIVVKNELFYARWDRYPVAKGHLLVLPFRHTRDYFALTPEEKRAMIDLIDEAMAVIREDFSPNGYNIGMNVGTAAGQTIMHCHCHVIPRYVGDVDRPEGGVRGVVPGRQGY
jgi:diadenosine tetraphosphate (Ap4A) HIT family hydrolase